MISASIQMRLAEPIEVRGKQNKENARGTYVLTDIFPAIANRLPVLEERSR